MTRKTLTALLAISFLLVVFASPQSAQERQAGPRTATGDRSQDPRQIVVVAEAEKFRKGVITAYSELEAAIRFLGEFDVIQHGGSTLKDADAICDSLASEQRRLAKLSTIELVAEYHSLPSSAAISRITQLAQKITTDPQFHEVMKKADRYFQMGRIHSSSAAKAPRANIRSTPSAPAFIDPTCDFTNPRDYPSGADISTPKGLAIVAAAAAEIVPETVTVAGFSAPFPLKAVLVGVAAGLEEIVNGFEGAQWDGQWCETFMQFVQDKLTTDEGNIALFTSDPYLDLVRRIVRASIDQAISDGINVPPCANLRYNEGVATSVRLDKFKKFRAAYQQISGSVACNP
ncbi:MAG TPA: hypothetical protein PLK30_14490 [Blastocatellia bacterium]|nr:hypothetical protein [Blastocatellia bacterium]